MKLYLVLCSILLSKSVLAAPSPDNSLLARISPNHEHKWELMVDKDGNTFLVDANPLTEDPSTQSFFNALQDVMFFVYTRSNPTTPDRVYLNNPTSIRNSKYDAKKPTRFIIHGWNNHGKSDVNMLLRDAFIAKTDCNVIVVDWGAGANHLVYSTSKGRIGDVGGVVAAFIDFLVKDCNTPIANILLTGHSLGGHTVGIVGKKVTAGRIQRCVALDPAGPLFSMKDVAGRVDANDCVFVEIIHTNTDILGFGDPIGNFDIYPDFGNTQNGCGVDLAGTCAHSRAFEYYAESIRNGGFTATRCTSYKEMTGTFSKKCTSTGSSHLGGEPHSVKPDGVYYVPINKKSPFSQG